MSIFNIDLQDDEGNSYRPMANPDSQTEFTKAGSRTNIASGDSFRTAWGKICKFFADLGTSAFSGLANNLTTTAAGYGMDARQGPVIQQKFDQINSNLNGYQFRVNNGVPEYKAGADAAWVPLGSGIYYIANYGELTAYGTSPKTYTIPVPAYVKSRVAASVYNNADNYVGLADTVVGIAPGGVPGNHQHPSTLTVKDGVITITVGANGASYYVQPRGKIYLVTGSIISA
ncbi:MAG: hypothetical protein SOV79_00270 [Eisenbergiella porci]|uniref:hypothetical protein n=2 Tax=Eisenbergiella porci TaxID=2652274 RepID=UPI002A758DB6|nr:hypothetical protein [Eisenbergiella porci]MDY2651028.1 hypothetical protein [Eisenbergiella porci]